MGKDYKILAQNVRSRLNPEGLLFEKAFRDELSTISYSDILVYIRTAMKGVPAEYTQRSMDAGEKVKGHLKRELTDVTYKYQGSVMTNTHIIGASDIDLLVICDKFYHWDWSEVYQILNNPTRKLKYYSSQIEKLEKETKMNKYQGDSIQDLRNNRLISERVLLHTYQICNVSKPKAIKVKNLNLNREVDIVIANWYDSVSSIIFGKGDNRGIQVYNKDTNSKGKVGFPFLSISRINNRSSSTNGRLKKMIRFLKNIKEDSDYKIKLNSFEINAVCYDIEPNIYINLSFYELVFIIYKQLKSIVNDESHANRIVSVDGTETIFRDNPEKIDDLRLLLTEVESIYSDLILNKKAI
jgi:hypothetical protein